MCAVDVDCGPVALCGFLPLPAGGEGQRQLRGSLLHVLDRCSTAAGGRMLRRWLAAPLADRSSILDRQQAVQVGFRGVAVCALAADRQAGRQVGVTMCSLQQ